MTKFEKKQVELEVINDVYAYVCSRVDSQRQYAADYRKVAADNCDTDPNCHHLRWAAESDYRAEVYADVLELLEKTYL